MMPANGMTAMAEELFASGRIRVDNMMATAKLREADSGQRTG